MKKKRKVGRPSKFASWMIDDAEEYLATGKTKQALAGHLRITEDTLYRWIKEHPKFSEAVSIGVNRYAGKYCELIHEGLFSETEYKNGKPVKARSMNSGIASLIGRNILKWDQKDKEETPTFNFNLNYDPKNLKDER